MPEAQGPRERGEGPAIAEAETAGAQPEALELIAQVEPDASVALGGEVPDAEGAPDAEPGPDARDDVAAQEAAADEAAPDGSAAVDDMAPYGGPALDPSRPDVPARPAPRGGVDAPELAESVAIARAAILEITSGDDVGDALALVDEGDGIYAIQFAMARPGYPDWRWTASLIALEGQDGPTVLETGLLPSESSLLAPAWVPWAERLADYEAARAAEEAPEEEAEQPVRRVERTRRRRRVTSDGESAPEMAAGSAAEGTSTAGERASSDQPDGSADAGQHRARRARGQRRRVVVGGARARRDDAADSAG